MAARVPAFFKFIVPCCFERIPIAPGYTKYRRANLPSTVILKDKYGNHWHVEVEKHQNEFFFAKGWKEFIEENHVVVGDYIVFNYGGPNVFDVTLLGHDSCDKKGARCHKNEVVNEDQEENFEVEEGIEDVEEKQEETLEASKDESADQDQVEFNFQKENNYDDDNKDNDEDEDEANSQMKGEMPRGRGRARDEKTKLGNESSINAHGSKIFLEQNISTPKNPYFVTRIRREGRDQLYVPVEVIKHYNLDLQHYMILQDPRGGEWYTKLTTWNDGRKWYFEGCASLRKVNLVQKDDRLVCEFVEEMGKKGLFLKVQILCAEDDVRI